ncbi:MAG: hypothetical protein WD035_03625 [Balneolaceae bacterium]
MNKLEGEHQFDLSKTILGTSVCSDEIIRSTTNFRDYASVENPFQLGGLAGFPFSGLTGLKAFAAHIPDSGSAIILYGPHIGISKNGEIGVMQRHGQILETTCCGALQASLSALQKKSEPADPELDYQLWRIEEELGKKSNDILAHEQPLVQTTEVMFDVIHSQIETLIHAAGEPLKGKKIALIGGIIINTDFDLPDWFELRRFEVRE